MVAPYRCIFVMMASVIVGVAKVDSARGSFYLSRCNVASKKMDGAQVGAPTVKHAATMCRNLSGLGSIRLTELAPSRRGHRSLELRTA